MKKSIVMYIFFCAVFCSSFLVFSRGEMAILNKEQFLSDFRNNYIYSENIKGVNLNQVILENNLAKTKENIAQENVGEENNSKENIIVSQYQVTDGKLLITNGKASVKDKKIWKEINRILTTELVDKHIDTLEIFYNKTSNNFAYVQDINRDGKWKIAINIYHYNKVIKTDRQTMIIHELGHILTLNNTQLISIGNNECKEYSTYEGCANSESYLNQFVKKFWTEKEIALARDSKKIDYNYAKYTTPYATLNPEEDMAESFAKFVTETKPVNKTTKDGKILFFYQYPEIISIKNKITKNIK